MPVFVITGASQGIGEAIVRRLAREPDAHVALLARNRTKLESVAGATSGTGAHTLVLPGDLTHSDVVDTNAGIVLENWGTPSLLVNNAGLFVPGGVLDTDPETFGRQIEVNLTSAFLMTRALLPSMLEANTGTIVFMASVASIRGYPQGAAYCAAKHGLLGLARALREETKQTGIRVSSILLGATMSPSWEGIDLPDSRFVSAEDVAETVANVYHLSDRAVVEEILIRPQEGDI